MFPGGGQCGHRRGRGPGWGSKVGAGVLRVREHWEGRRRPGGPGPQRKGGGTEDVHKVSVCQGSSAGLRGLDSEIRGTSWEYNLLRAHFGTFCRTISLFVHDGHLGLFPSFVCPRRWAEADRGPTLPPCAGLVLSTQHYRSPWLDREDSLLSPCSPPSDGGTDAISHDVRTSTPVPSHRVSLMGGEGVSFEDLPLPASWAPGKGWRP